MLDALKTQKGAPRRTVYDVRCTFKLSGRGDVRDQTTRRRPLNGHHSSRRIKLGRIISNFLGFMIGEMVKVCAFWFDIDMRNAACINVGHIVFCSGGSLKNRKPLSNTNMCVINRRNWKCSSNLKPLSQNLIAFCVRLRKENIKSRISHFVCQRQNFDS